MNDVAKSDANSLLGRASSSAHQAIDNATDAAKPAVDWLGNQVDGAIASKEKYVDESSRYIANNPLKAVAIAALAGFFISKIIR